MSTPLAAPPVDKDSEIDVEWERFAQNGCPDWWLMAKYTSGWLSRSFPYVGFKGTPSGPTARTQSNSGVELQQAIDAAAAVGRAEAAPSRLARSQSCDSQQLLGAPAVAPAAAASLPPAPVTADEPPSSMDRATNDRDVATRSATAAGPVTTTAGSPVQTTAAHSATPAAGLEGHTPGCAPLKGLFACQCAAMAHEDRAVDQAAS